MSRNKAVLLTLALPGVPRPVGRPRKADALSNAERQKLFRRRIAAMKKILAEGNRVSVTRNGN